MNTKRIGTGIAALLALALLTAGSLTLTSCFNPLAKEETQGRFVIGGSSARAYFDKTSDTDIAQLTLDITVSDGPGPEQHKTGSGLGGVAFTVAPGTWTITVRAYFNNNFAAYGTTTMNISAGDNNVVVDMHTFEAGLYQIKGAEYVYVPATDVVSNDVASAISYIHGNPGTYILFMQHPPAPVPALDPIGPQTLGAGEHLTLMGITGEGVTTATTIKSSGGTLFTVSNGASLTLDDNIILSGATNSAVRVDTGGTFTMRGGTISGNISNKGGGVYVDAGGRFTKTGGEISGNNATDGTSNGHSVYVRAPRRFYDSAAGTGVYLDSATDANWESAPIVNAILPALTAIPPVNCPLNSPQSLTVDVSNRSGIMAQGGTLTYQWYRNTANSTTGGTVIGGATLASYSPSTTSAGTFYYYVTVTNTITDNGDGGLKVVGAASNVVTVTVTNSSPTFPTSAGLYRVAGGIYTQVLGVTPNNLTSAFTKLTSAGTYLLLFDDDGTVTEEEVLSVTGGNTIELTIQGLTSERTITFTWAGIPSTGGIEIGQNGHLILADNITLKGSMTANSALVRLEYVNAQLTMKSSSKITGTINTNIISPNYGGGVAVQAGTFTMEGGTISANQAEYGGGVYVHNGVFEKKVPGATIHGGLTVTTDSNIATATSTGSGHAVYVRRTPPLYRDELAGSADAIRSNDTPPFGFD